MTPPADAALTLAYWFHMLGTVVWIGGLTAMTWLVIPLARRALTLRDYTALMGQVQKRLQNLGWFSLLLLVGTGLFQMSASPNYTGFLAIQNRWALAILLKHLAIGGMILVSIYQTWGLTPALHRTSLRMLRRTEKGEALEPGNLQLEALQRRELWLLRINLALSVVVLGFTAFARAAQ
jgi:uncharacterized membrane protein